MENNRSLSVDITKGTAIIAIVLGHIAFSYPSCRLVHCGVSILLPLHQESKKNVRWAKD